MAADKMIQDDSRESAMATLLRLERLDGRSGTDALDENGTPYELKSTGGTSVTTARDFGRAYIARMRARYLVVGVGRNTTFGFNFSELWVLDPADLGEWIGAYENRFDYDESLVEEACHLLERAGDAPERVERLRAIGRRGLTLNNPKIPMAYIRGHGTQLLESPADDLRAFVASRRLTAA